MPPIHDTCAISCGCFQKGSESTRADSSKGNSRNKGSQQTINSRAFVPSWWCWWAMSSHAMRGHYENMCQPVDDGEMQIWEALQADKSVHRKTRILSVLKSVAAPSVQRCSLFFPAGMSVSQVEHQAVSEICRSPRRQSCSESIPEILFSTQLPLRDEVIMATLIEI